MLAGEPEGRIKLREIIPSMFSLRKMIEVKNKLNCEGENQEIKSVALFYKYSS